MKPNDIGREVEKMTKESQRLFGLGGSADRGDVARALSQVELLDKIPNVEIAVASKVAAIRRTLDSVMAMIDFASRPPPSAAVILPDNPGNVLGPPKKA